jgi:hypothetical protein
MPAKLDNLENKKSSGAGRHHIAGHQVYLGNGKGIRLEDFKKRSRHLIFQQGNMMFPVFLPMP